MRQTYRSMLWAGLVAAGVAACGDDVTVTPPAPPPPPPAATVHSVSVTPDGVTVGIGANIVTMIASVNADAGVATTVTWTTSDAAKATIATDGKVTTLAAGAVGIRACSTVNPAVCGDATLTISSTAPTATVVTVTPGSATYVNGQTPVTYTASVQGTNSPSQTVTWSTTSGGSSVVSVNANSGVVTIVAVGNDVIKACSTIAGFTNVCGSSAVQVVAPQPTQITVQKIEQNNTTVDLSNVSGQVDVTVNVDPGAGAINKVQVLINGTAVAAEQVVVGPVAPAVAGNGGSANAVQPITLSFNTRMVKKLANNTYVPVFFNGPNLVSAKLFIVGNATPIPSSNVIPIVLQNQDAWIPGTTPVLSPASTTPSASGTISSGGATWYKSNVNFVGGANYVSFFPVTPSITFNSSICGASSNAVVGTFSTGITFSGTFTCGSPAEGSVTLNNPAGNVTPGTAPAADVVYIAADNEDTEQVGSPFTVAGDTRYNLLDGSSLDSGNGVYVDFKVPTVTIGVIAFNANYDQKWVNGSYDLTSRVTVTDAGSGTNSAATATRFWAGIAGCTGALITTSTASSLAETLTSAGFDAYTICGTGADNIGNAAASGASNTFGVDKTAPVARLAGSTAATPSIAPSNTSAVSTSANTTIYATGAQINNQVFGLEGFDNRSGFNQSVVAGDDAAHQVQTRTLASGVTACSVNDQLTQVLSDDWIRMPVLPLIECGSGLTGYYDYTGWVIDRAGNTSNTFVRNFAYDLSAPVTSFVSPNQVTYTAATSASFNVIAQDDLEVLKAYLGFSFPTLAPPATGILYPYGSFAGLIISSPWPTSAPIAASVPSAGTSGTISIPYLLARIDESCTGAAVPYPSCGATLGSKTAVSAEYNRDLNLNAPVATDQGMVPVAIVTNVQDIALRDGLTGAAFAFNPVTFVTGVSEQWSAATDISTWLGKNASGDCPAGTFCADQKTSTSNGLRYFETVTLWRLNTATNQWTYCSDMTSGGGTPFIDNGVYRVWRWSLSNTLPAGNACIGLTGFWKVMGVKAGAGLFAPVF